jgi:hypothetical protein
MSTAFWNATSDASKAVSPTTALKLVMSSVLTVRIPPAHFFCEDIR